jgi:hypothetical protein
MNRNQQIQTTTILMMKNGDFFFLDFAGVDLHFSMPPDKKLFHRGLAVEPQCFWPPSLVVGRFVCSFVCFFFWCLLLFFQEWRENL